MVIIHTFNYNPNESNKISSKLKKVKLNTNKKTIKTVEDGFDVLYDTIYDTAIKDFIKVLSGGRIKPTDAESAIEFLSEDERERISHDIKRSKNNCS